MVMNSARKHHCSLNTAIITWQRANNGLLPLHSADDALTILYSVNDFNVRHKPRNNNNNNDNVIIWLTEEMIKALIKY